MKTMTDVDTDVDTVTSAVASGTRPRPQKKNEYPVRDYIAAMTGELAQMARWDGDEALALLLEAAETRALGEAPGPGLTLPARKASA